MSIGKPQDIPWTVSPKHPGRVIALTIPADLCIVGAVFLVLMDKPVWWIFLLIAFVFFLFGMAGDKQ
jgi:hypothetical protein